MKKTKMLQVRVSEAFMQALKEASGKGDFMGRSMSQIVFDAMMRQEPEVWKRANEIYTEWAKKEKVNA